MAEKQKRRRCIFLGSVIEKTSRCRSLWRRKCEIHGKTTLRKCRTCADHESDV